jgi:hypothetical protein
MSKTALIWPFRYKDIRIYPNNEKWAWQTRLNWVCDGLRSNDYTILQHPDLLADLGETSTYENQKEVDVIIFNHSDCEEEEVRKCPVQFTHRWFFKPTVPDGFHTTLDSLGYGSYSSITYDKPNYESVDNEEVNHFFDTQVKEWVDGLDSKWGKTLFQNGEIIIKDYHLIIAQCGGDSVVTRQDLGGHYFEKLKAIIQHLNSISPNLILVKLHPYTNGPDPNQEPDIRSKLTNDYKAISPKVHIVSDFTSVHSLLPNCKNVIVGNSGSGFEAMMHHKPMISFCCPEYHWVTYDLRKLCDLRRALDTDSWFDRESSDKFLYWYMRQYCFHDQESAKSRVDQLLCNI